MGGNQVGVNKQATIKPSNNAPRAASNPYGGVEHSSTGDVLGWDAVNSMLLAEAVAAVNRAGDAITFARGAHGRWLSITILCGEGNSTLRAFSMEEAESVLQDLIRVASARS
jgi:hypothetical protein